MRSISVLMLIPLTFSCHRAPIHHISQPTELMQLAVENKVINDAVEHFFLRGEVEGEDFLPLALVIYKDENAQEIALEGLNPVIRKSENTYQFRISTEGLSSINSYIQDKKEMFLGYFIYHGPSKDKSIPVFVFSHTVKPFFSKTSNKGSFDYIHPLREISEKERAVLNTYSGIGEEWAALYEYKEGNLQFIGSGFEYSLFE